MAGQSVLNEASAKDRRKCTIRLNMGCASHVASITTKATARAASDRLAKRDLHWKRCKHKRRSRKTAGSSAISHLEAHRIALVHLPHQPLASKTTPHQMVLKQRNHKKLKNCLNNCKKKRTRTKNSKQPHLQVIRRQLSTSQRPTPKMTKLLSKKRLMYLMNLSYGQTTLPKITSL